MSSIDLAHSGITLQASGLKVLYGGNTALNLDRIEVGEGEVVGVVGANGAGKSTLVNALAGWSRGVPKVPDAEGKMTQRPLKAGSRRAADAAIPSLKSSVA